MLRLPALWWRRSQQLRNRVPGFLLAHKPWLLFSLGLALLLFLGASIRDSYQHQRSYLAARSVSGRLDALRLDQHPVDVLRDAVRQANDPELGKRQMQGGQEELGDNLALVKSVKSLVAQLLAVEETVPCQWDPTLEADLHQLERGKFLIAANFRNNEQLLPHVIIQLWHLLAILPPGSAFVSVYESGSQDSTGAWLEVLSQVLKAMRVRYRIIAGGSLRRAKGQDRIDFLAQVRNAALEPLWEPSEQREGRNASSGQQTKQPWKADKIIFVNDVYFCAGDAVRLLLHDADMSCGMDFDRRKLDHMTRKFIKRHQHLYFYDIWVSRDSNGVWLRKEQPYSSDPYTLERLPWGLPFPVKCCWNGLVVLNAAPFTRHNLRVRAHQEGECSASECSLVCNDFIRLGYRNLVLDPGVRQAYTARNARDLYQPQWVPGINVTSWAEVTRAAPIDWSLTPFRPYSQCCTLQPGKDIVDMHKDCAWENVLSPNFTALALGSSGTPDGSTAFNASLDDRRRPAAARQKSTGASVWEH